MDVAHNQQQSSAPLDTLHIPVDASHSGIQAATLLTMFGVGIVSFILLLLLIPNLTIIAAIGAIIIGLAAAYIVEHLLKRIWPSGRVLHANPESIVLRKHDAIQQQLNPQQHINVHTWRIKIKRSNPHAQKGWFLLGMALEQDGDYLTVYSFTPPDDFEDLPLAERFTLLEKNPPKQRNHSNSGMRLAGEQRRLYEAEVNRGFSGAQMELPEFLTTITYLQDQFPHWMIRST